MLGGSECVSLSEQDVDNENGEREVRRKVDIPVTVSSKETQP